MRYRNLPLAWLLPALLAITVLTVPATEYQVAVTGNDGNAGTAAAPFRSIAHAAALALPGDVITVHAGVYRERVAPPRGGESDTRRITYQAAPGEVVAIKGSEPVTNWLHWQGEVWLVTISNTFFGAFNPYADLIHGDWFNSKGRAHHTGAVYLNGEWLTEAAQHDDLLAPAGTRPFWFGRVDGDVTTIWAQFPGVNPNEQQVEINVRQTVFYPEQTGIDYITVRGFTLADAATPWAPPTAEQMGVIGTHWSKGWIIESNVVSYSTCCGIALGKYGDVYDNTSANSAEGYVKTVQRALAHGWNAATIGHHCVRGNEIAHCEQAGIVGSLGAAFSTVTGNTIHDIHVRKLFTGAEMAGIKFHGAVDVQISHNHIYRTCRGVWLDWMAQGTRISGNLLHDNDEDVFMEVNHGPFILDNNLLLSAWSLRDCSGGGAYAHNLFAGSINLLPFDQRQVPWLKPHGTAIAGFHNNPHGDDRYYNNLFTGRADLHLYDGTPLPLRLAGNVYCNGARPSRQEPQPLIQPDFNPAPRLTTSATGWGLQMQMPAFELGNVARPLVTTARLGLAAVPQLPYEASDGSPLTLDTDYFGHPRNPANPAPGPFENPGMGVVNLSVW